MGWSPGLTAQFEKIWWGGNLRDKAEVAWDCYIDHRSATFFLIKDQIRNITSFQSHNIFGKILNEYETLLIKTAMFCTLLICGIEKQKQWNVGYYVKTSEIFRRGTL